MTNPTNLARLRERLRGRLPSPPQGFREQRDKPVVRDMGIDLRGFDVLVSEQALHHAEVRAVVHHVRRE